MAAELGTSFPSRDFPSSAGSGETEPLVWAGRLTFSKISFYQENERV